MSSMPVFVAKKHSRESLRSICENEEPRSPFNVDPGATSELNPSPFRSLPANRVYGSAGIDRVVVVLETAIEAEAAIEDERSDERTGPVPGRGEARRECCAVLAERALSIEVNRVFQRGHPCKQRRVCRQRQRNRCDRFVEADAARRECIDGRSPRGRVTVRANPIGANRVESDQKDIERGGVRFSGPAAAPSEGAHEKGQRKEDTSHGVECGGSSAALQRAMFAIVIPSQLVIPRCAVCLALYPRRPSPSLEQGGRR